MSDWQIRIPYRDRSDPLTSVVDASCELPTDEDRAVVRQLVLGEIVGGSATTAGELLDLVEKAAPDQRRKMLDVARVKAGLPTTGDVEFEARFKMVQHAARVRAGTDHRPMRLAYNETGGIVDLNDRDDDIAREQAREESLRRIREDQAAVRAVEAEAVREHQEGRAAALRSELPPGVPG
jgi:hypothetical protein